jgi:hypothetical protein
VEKTVKENAALFEGFADRRAMQILMFDLMVTYSLYNFDGAAYNPALLKLLFPFVDAFVAQNGENDTNCASEVFRVFTFFFEAKESDFGDLKKASKQPFVRKVLHEVGILVKAKFPDLLQLLVQNHVFTLDFLREDISVWFLDVFATADVRRLWIALFLQPSITEAFVSFVIALLIAALRQMEDFDPLCSEEFVERFGEVKRRLALPPLLAAMVQIAKAIAS